MRNLLLGITLAVTFIVGLLPITNFISSANAATFSCSEYKTRLANQTAREAATDIPSWASGERPCKNPNETGSAFAKRLLDAKYGAGNYKTGTNTEYSKLQKFGDSAF